MAAKKNPLDTPMMKQYRKYKEQHPEAVLFFRLGDFYEMFFKDAEIASDILDIALTSRHKDAKIPMAGVPAHSMESYARKLLDAGFCVAVCEQIEKPDKTKKMVKREVVRVMTPGTVVEEESLDDGNNYLAAVNGTGSSKSVVWVDVSSGELFFTSVTTSDDMSSLLKTIDVRELISVEEIPDFSSVNIDSEEFSLWVPSQRSAEYLSDYSDVFQKNSRVEEALHLTLFYLDTIYFGKYPPLQPPRRWSDSSIMRLDYNTIANLEIERTMMGGHKKGSLLHIMDRTATAMGRRNLSNAVKTPLTDIEKINLRHDVVDFFLNEPNCRKTVFSILRKIRDFERVVSRILVRRGGPREVIALADSLLNVLSLEKKLKNMETLPELLKTHISKVHIPEKEISRWKNAFVEDPPVQYKEGGFISREYSPEVTRLYDIIHNARDLLLELETEEREKTAIPSLKIGHTRVFGYYIEVRKRYSEKVPRRYVRKQTMRNAERYFTEELKKLENEILTAREKLTEIEMEILESLVCEIEKSERWIRKAARFTAWIDTFVSFATLSGEQSYCRPLMKSEGGIKIINGRHPVIEALQGQENYVPANVEVGTSERRMNIITGPNMGGKSTLMRMTALTVLLAQTGCFVPADEAELVTMDAVFTRVGASDNLSKGESTFLVEMKEASVILKNATHKSLVILDEIGRGTGTYDGMSLARSIADYMIRNIGALTLFATHYHMLTELADEYESVSNFYMDAREYKGNIKFLYQMKEGGSSRSFGIEVASLANMPKEVVKKADKYLKEFEKLDRRMRFEQGSSMQMDIFSMAIEEQRNSSVAEAPEYINEIKKIVTDNNPDNMTPRNALDLFYKLKKLVKNEQE